MTADAKFTMFVCNDMEEAWIASICAQGEREMAEWERQEDIDREQELRTEFFEDLEGGSIDPDDWPWYADAPYEVQLPEVFET